MKGFSIRYVFVMLLSLFLLSSCSSLDVQTLNKKAVDLMNSGDVDGAISRLESINDLNPNIPQTQYNLGIAYHKKGKNQKAINALNKAVKLNKKFSDAYFTLGVIYEEIAYNEIDKLKNNQKPKIDVIVQNLHNSLNSYSEYLKVTAYAPDVANINTKINQLKTDLQKYESRPSGT